MRGERIQELLRKSKILLPPQLVGNVKAENRSAVKHAVVLQRQVQGVQRGVYFTIREFDGQGLLHLFRGKPGRAGIGHHQRGVNAVRGVKKVSIRFG